jgi:hypothetical protein
MTSLIRRISDRINDRGDSDLDDPCDHHDEAAAPDGDGGDGASYDGPSDGPAVDQPSAKWCCPKTKQSLKRRIISSSKPPYIFFPDFGDKWRPSFGRYFRGKSYEFGHITGFLYPFPTKAAVSSNQGSGLRRG